MSGLWAMVPRPRGIHTFAPAHMRAECPRDLGVGPVPCQWQCGEVMVRGLGPRLSSAPVLSFADRQGQSLPLVAAARTHSRLLAAYTEPVPSHVHTSVRTSGPCSAVDCDVFSYVFVFKEEFLKLINKATGVVQLVARGWVRSDRLNRHRACGTVRHHSTDQATARITATGRDQTEQPPERGRKLGQEGCLRPRFALRACQMRPR